MQMDNVWVPMTYLERPTAARRWRHAPTHGHHLSPSIRIAHHGSRIVWKDARHRPLGYADHWLKTGSGGGDRCDGVGIITVPPEMREACRSVENDREWLTLELSRPVSDPKRYS
jgi:hypothetical protein